jgi:4-amino-4-deoxy-L-arabinose transferase-like glycosyltransferase
MSPHRVALLLLVLLGIGLRLTYTARAGDGFVQEPRVGELAHSIVANGRWFVRNSRAEKFVEAESVRRDRLIDPALIDYKGIVLVANYLMVMRSRHRWRWLVAGGLLAGVGAYFRPQVLLLFPVLALVTATATGWREAFRRIAVAIVTASLVVAMDDP